MTTQPPRLRATPAADPDDACYSSASAPSLAFHFHGRDIFIVPDGREEEVYNDLKRRTTPTTRIIELTWMPFGMYRCVLRASDGSFLKVFITREGVRSNLDLTNEVVRPESPDASDGRLAVF